jgi:hypothetical protein
MSLSSQLLIVPHTYNNSNSYDATEEQIQDQKYWSEYDRFERRVKRLAKNVQEKDKLMAEAVKVAPNSIKQKDINEVVLRIFAKKQRKQFKKKLYSIDTSRADSETIAKKLFNIMPTSMELEDVVNIEFKQSPKDAPNLIKAIRLKHPSFTLSTINQMRVAIVEDKQYMLTNQSLFEMIPISESEGFDKNKLNLCYDLAYRLYHPYIYHPAEQPVTANQYTLNFLWVNLNPQDRIANIAQNIFKDGQDLAENAACLTDPDRLRQYEKEEAFLDSATLKNWENIKNSFTYRLSKWADIHPSTEMNLWYDSALVTAQARDKTSEMLKGISYSRGVRLQLRDIRALPRLDSDNIYRLDRLDEIPLSLHPGTPLYYRVDILKALIADHMINPKEQEGKKYCVMSDIDVTPINAKQMFNQRTLDFLNTKGYVLQAIELWNYENSFFIFNRDHPELSRIHSNMIVNAIESQISSLRKYPLGKTFDSELILNSQCVYRKYWQFDDKMREVIGPEYNRQIHKIKPRIIVQSPSSQFILSSFSGSDHRAESFRFIGISSIPYTKGGRNFEKGKEESPIEALMHWNAEPCS